MWGCKLDLSGSSAVGTIKGGELPEDLHEVSQPDTICKLLKVVGSISLQCAMSHNRQEPRVCQLRKLKPVKNCNRYNILSLWTLKMPEDEHAMRQQISCIWRPQRVNLVKTQHVEALNVIAWLSRSCPPFAKLSSLLPRSYKPTMAHRLYLNLFTIIIFMKLSNKQLNC